MRTLFLLILGVVFIFGRLLFPNDIGFSDVVFTATPPSAAFQPVMDRTNTPFPTMAAATPYAEQVDDGGVINNPARDGNSENAAGTNGNTEANDAPADPASIFGESKVIDTFERGSSGFGLNAGLNDDENIRIISINNQLSLQPKKNSGWLTWRLRPPVISDGAAQMEFSLITCARGDRTGIVMRANDYSSGKGYYFSLSCEGTATILRDSQVIGTADAGGVFKNSSGDINVMTAIIRGNRLSLALNGTNLLNVSDDTYTEGYSGFFTAPQGENTLTMNIQSFREYYNQ